MKLKMIVLSALLMCSLTLAGSWTQTAPAAAPAPAAAHVLSYIENNKVLFFGSYLDGMNAIAETWLYNAGNDTWTKLTTAGSPAPRIRAAMAFVGNSKVILYGGNPLVYGQSPITLAKETWLFDLSTNTWTKLNTIGNPPALAGHGMCFSGGTDKAVLFGGVIVKSATLPGLDSKRSNQTWVFDLSDKTWTKSSAVGPSARTQVPLLYMGGDKAILFGGYDGSAQLDDTWRFDRSGDKWVKRNPAGGVKPPARYSHTGGYVQDGMVVLFGGRADALPDPNENTETIIFGDTWVYDNAANTWREDAGVPAPSNRANARMAETNRNNPKPVVLFGGLLDESTVYGDTWEFSYVGLNKGGAPELTSVQPTAYVLEQNYPNPFNPTTAIRFQLPKDAQVRLTVYDALGQEVALLLDGMMEAGAHQAVWNASDQPSGTYIYRLEAGDVVETKRMVLLK